MAGTHSSTSAVPQTPLCMLPDVGALRAAMQQLVVPSALEVCGDRSTQLKWSGTMESDDNNMYPSSWSESVVDGESLSDGKQKSIFTNIRPSYILNMFAPKIGITHVKRIRYMVYMREVGSRLACLFFVVVPRVT